jgi:hypothetical protein
MERLGRQ